MTLISFPALHKTKMERGKFCDAGEKNVFLSPLLTCHQGTLVSPQFITLLLLSGKSLQEIKTVSNQPIVTCTYKRYPYSNTRVYPLLEKMIRGHPPPFNHL